MPVVGGADYLAFLIIVMIMMVMMRKRMLLMTMLMLTVHCYGDCFHRCYL